MCATDNLKDSKGSDVRAVRFKTGCHVHVMCAILASSSSWQILRHPALSQYTTPTEAVLRPQC